MKPLKMKILLFYMRTQFNLSCWCTGMPNFSFSFHRLQEKYLFFHQLKINIVRVKFEKLTPNQQAKTEHRTLKKLVHSFWTLIYIPYQDLLAVPKPQPLKYHNNFLF